jgi:hypothetical protein
MKRDDSPRHQIQWDILGFIGLIVAALIAAGVAIWQTKVERSDDRPPAEVTGLGGSDRHPITPSREACSDTANRSAYAAPGNTFSNSVCCCRSNCDSITAPT